MNKLIHNKNVIKVILVIACIALTAISCGTQATWPAVLPTTYQQVVLPMATVPHVTAVSTNVESINKTETTYTVTAPLHVRKCASINCDVLAYLQTGDSVVVKFSVAGPGCAGADWYAIEWQGWTGFVCSIYLEEQ